MKINFSQHHRHGGVSSRKISLNLESHSEFRQHKNPGENDTEIKTLAATTLKYDGKIK